MVGNRGTSIGFWVRAIGKAEHEMPFTGDGQSYPNTLQCPIARYFLPLLADPVDRPAPSRNVVRLPLLLADPIERPLASLNVV